MNYRRFILAICFGTALVSAADSFKIKTKVQPLISLEQKGSTSDSGDYFLGFNRLKLSTDYEKMFAGEKRIAAELSLDFSKKELDKLVKKATLSLTFRREIALKIGQWKVPFYTNDYVGSGSLRHVHRNFTTYHLRNELAVTGYKQGVSLEGTFLEERLSYGAGLFYDESKDIKGFDGSELVMLPSLHISYKPWEFLSLEYGGLFPEFCTKTVQNNMEKKRLSLHTFSIAYEAPVLYDTELDIFIGVDTADGREMMQFQLGYTENTSMSIHTNHRFRLPLKEKSALHFSVAGEFLNGLTYYDGEYHNRAFTYALFGTVAYIIRKNLQVEVTLDERFDNNFAAIKQKRAALQCTFSPTLLSRSK